MNGPKQTILPSLTPRQGIGAIAAGTAFGQVILVASTPILSRLYSTQDFGAFSTLVAFTSVIGVCSALKFDAALMLAPSDDGARRLMRLGITAALIISGITGLTTWMLERTSLASAWSAIPIAPIWTSLMVLSTALFTLLTQAALRSKQYSRVARRAPIQSATTGVAQIAIGLASKSSPQVIGSPGLIAGFLLGRTIGSLSLFRTCREFLWRPAGGSYAGVIKSYWRFPIAFTPSAFLNALGSQLPILMLSSWFGAIVAGQVGMAQRIVLLPAALLGTAVAQVFGAELAHRLRAGEAGARKLYLRTTAQLAIASFLITAIIMVLSPLLIPPILGPGWLATGQLCQAVALGAGASLIASPLSQVYLVYQSLMSVAIDVSRVVIVALAGLLTWHYGLSPLTTCWLISSGQVVNYLMTWAYGLRIASRNEKGL